MAKIDSHQMITDRVFARMQECGSDWIKPFSGAQGMPCNAETGKNYRGINTILLWSMPFADNRWGTYKTWQRIGGQVSSEARGKSAKVVKWHFKEDKKKRDKNGRPVSYAWLQTFSVFNAEQLTPETRPDPVEAPVDLVERNERVETFLANTGAKVRHSGEGRAYYSPSGDFIHMPLRENFEATDTSTATETYFSTSLHEHIHWTGGKDRLDRLTPASFGSAEYAYEELVAELGAAIGCAELGLSVEPRDDHAKYLNSWMKALQNEPKFLMSAAGKASKAFGYLESLQGEEE